MIGTDLAWQPDDCGDGRRMIAGSVSIAESNNPTPAPAGGIVPEKEQGGRRRCRYRHIPDTGFKFLRKIFSGEHEMIFVLCASVFCAFVALAVNLVESRRAVSLEMLYASGDRFTMRLFLMGAFVLVFYLSQ